MAELVHSFLIPEVAKQESRNKGSDTRPCPEKNTASASISVRLAQHKYLIGAHRVVQETCAENLSESLVTERQQRLVEAAHRRENPTPPADEQDEKEESLTGDADDEQEDD